MRAVADALIQLARLVPVDIKVVLHPNPAMAAAMRKAWLPCPAIDLLPPLGHAGMIAEMRRADVLLSDSGGVQEEAPALGVPLLVLREKTERPEGIATGNMLLVGTNRDRIIASVIRLTDPAIRAAMSRPSLPFGDGQSGPRIAAAVMEWVVQPPMRKAG
jgi:UDP-N-acetylglucosamine 2-epimerase (non-hydrolysing)